MAGSAVAGHNPGAGVLNVMARDAEAKVGKFTAQNMSNTLLAYAKLEHHPGHLMEVMAAEALRKLDQFTPQVRLFLSGCVDGVTVCYGSLE